MNYYLQDICCFCLSISNEQNNIMSSLTKHSENLNNFEKIKTTFMKLSTMMEIDSRICTKCSETVDFIYNFNKTCLKNINILSSYKKILEENMSKKRCDLYVNLSESKQSIENQTSSIIQVKIEPPESPLNNDGAICETDFVSENYSNGAVEIKEEVTNYEICDETFETPLLNSEFKIEIDEINLKEELFNEIEGELENEYLKLNTEDLRNIPKKISLENANFTEEENTEQIKEEYLLKIAEEKLQESQEDDESNKQNQKPTDTNTKIYSCYECGKNFNSSQSLRYHLRIHSDVKPSHQKCHKRHKCHICEKLFSSTSNLKFHILMHMGVKPYNCEICNKGFTQLRYLNEHIRTHTGEKPYKCEFCERKFAQNSTYNRHRRIHTGEKPYQCNICNKSFIQHSHLKYHIQKH